MQVIGGVRYEEHENQLVTREEHREIHRRRRQSAVDALNTAVAVLKADMTRYVFAPMIPAMPPPSFVSGVLDSWRAKVDRSVFNFKSFPFSAIV